MTQSQNNILVDARNFASMPPKILMDFNFLHQKPLSSGIIKSQFEDFIVIEDLGFTLSGEGEHLFIEVQKCNANTRFVAEVLAKHLNIPSKFISHAGLKDRHGITTQWLSIHLPGKETPVLTHFEHPEFKILQQTRHDKKLKMGALAGNFFELTIRQISHRESVENKLFLIQSHGVPNYFGMQRFGNDLNNLHKVMAWAEGNMPRLDRTQKSFLLSSAKSYLFNLIVSQRIHAQQFGNILANDYLQFSDGNGFFKVTADELDSCQDRFLQGKLRITAPLIGKLSPKEMVQNSLSLDAFLSHEFEIHAVSSYQKLLNLLRKETENQRRAIVLFPQDMHWQWPNKDTLKINFYLPAGSYATSVVREIIGDEMTSS